MKLSATAFVVAGALAGWTPASAQTPSAVATGTSDLYHVHFTKAAPGEAAALGKALSTPDSTAAMPDHFVVLRHQEGDDWDYVVIQHLGAKAEITASAPAPPDAQRALSAWHADTFVVGPAWGEFTKQMGLGAANASSQLYIVGVHRPVPGHREQLLKSLSAPSPESKIQTGNLLFEHVEGGDWSYLTITRYNSWQDLAADRTAAGTSAATAAGGWDDIRQHSAFHRDTIAGRIYPAK